MTKYLRAKTNGFVFEYNDRLAALPEWEEVTEQEAFPERFSPVDLTTREKQIDLTVPEELVVAPPTVSPELTADASRPFNSAKATRAPKADAAKPAVNVAGLQGAF